MNKNSGLQIQVSISIRHLERNYEHGFGTSDSKRHTEHTNQGVKYDSYDIPYILLLQGPDNSILTIPYRYTAIRLWGYTASEYKGLDILRMFQMCI